ncbi:hypothetical protein MRB53_023222 [Persea americana]|uniref:Uncharacterized protein n=1 Tax=Persea americana TaxID=3435 RepID=A0ACC2L8X3_PERAE|nr:hypothetical protein MRB53_023222 [Persea americana]
MGENPSCTVLSPHNQLEILSPAVVDGVQSLDHEHDNEEDVEIKAIEKETKAEQGERNTKELLNELEVETRNDGAKLSGAVPVGFETARSPKKRDDGLTPPFVEKAQTWIILSRIQRKTVALVGDSLGRQQFQSLMCMVTGGKDNPEVEDVGSEFGLIKAAEPLNFTYPATGYVIHLDRPPAFLQCYVHIFDVLVLNTRHQWNKGKLNANWWVMYVAGVGRVRCVNKVSQDESDDSVVAGAVKGTGVRLLDITALSQLREEGHISLYSLKASDGVQDCLHWCLPGIPDTWNEILYAQL